MDDVHRHGGNGNGCDLVGSKNNAMNRKGFEDIVFLISMMLVAFVVGMTVEKHYSKHDAPAINYEAIIQSKSDSLERVVQQLQDCRKDREKQDTIITDQRSYIEQFEGSKKARPPNW